MPDLATAATVDPAPPGSKDRMSRRQRYLQRLSMLKSERSTWDSHWREIADLMLPRRFRYNLSDANRGSRKNDKILNGEAGLAIRTLAAGMMAGIVSPSRPWMRLSLSDPKMAEIPEVRDWLHTVTQRVLQLFARTNFYRATSSATFVDLGTFGTHLTLVLPDRETGIRFYPVPLGQYWLASSAKGTIDTCYREFMMTVAQLVEEFGHGQCSLQVQQLFDRERYDVKFPVLHVIEPNRAYDPKKADVRGKRWLSCWLESNNPENRSLGFLRESGHRLFPGLAPRWTTDGEDVYGRGPGMDALPTVRQTEKLELKLAMLVDKATTPPMKGPAAMEQKGQPNLSAGGMSFVPAGNQGSEKFEPAYVPVPGAIEHTERAIERRERKIKAFFFVDFWLAMINDERATPATAEEIRAKKEERLLQLGPVLESVQDEFLAPAVDLAFDAAQRIGILPPVPKQLAEALRARGLTSLVFDVEYVSIAAAAQRALGITNLREFLNLVGLAGQFDAQALTLVDVDQVVREVAAMLGINPKVVRAMEVVKQLRAAAARQQHAAETGQALATAADAGAKAARAPAPAPDNLLGVLQAMGPAAAQLLPAPSNQVP